MNKLRQVKRDDGQDWERVAWAEVLVPDTPNTWADMYSRQAIIDFRDEYMRSNYGLDVEHDRVDVRNELYYVVESFIARDDDPDFIPGSWVIGVKVIDDALWQDILDGKLNGFSFDAEVFMEPINLLYDDASERLVRTGVTEPDPFDGHTHTFLVVLGPLNKVISGSTGETDGHSHPLTAHTITGEAASHTHRYQVVGD